MAPQTASTGLTAALRKLLDLRSETEDLSQGDPALVVQIAMLLALVILIVIAFWLAKEIGGPEPYNSLGA